MNQKWIYLVVLLAALVAPAIGQPPVPVLDASVDSLFGEYTLAVARFDLTLLDTDATIESVLRLAPEEHRPELERGAAEAAGRFDAFKQQWQEAGLKEVYLVFDLDDLGRRPPLFAAAVGNPFARQEARQLLGSSFHEFDRATNGLVRGCSVLADARTIERLRSPDHRADARWAQAFDAIAPGALQVVLKPYHGWERVVEEMSPTLPDVVGGGPSTALTRGLDTAWLSMGVGEGVKLRARVDSRSSADAAALRDVILAGLDALGEHQEMREGIPNWDAIKAALTPAVEDSGLSIVQGEDTIAELIMGYLLPFLSAPSRQAALQTASMHTLKQIGLGFHVYASEHDGATAEHFAQILPYLGSDLQMGPSRRQALPDGFRSWDEAEQRAWLDEHAGYIYVHPGTSVKDITRPATTVIAYERSGQVAGGDSVAALFADGHVEKLASRGALEALLDRQSP